MSWVFLSCAIVLELLAAASLRVAAVGRRPGFYVPVVFGYTAAFTLLGFTLNAGMGIGVAYGIWTAVGVAATALVSRFVFQDPLNRVMLMGIGLIAAGVLAVELSSSH
ncbi:DMT family transporter [Rhodococcoides yunnanense]|uniref:SMR family transporter n=1 Tax=Rhodococcoides yunnanense TaxID=278209 RepID=A0ABU4BIR9_9NOCA|nr:SMR family transporter [Rhodococcus yunnanensis]MDV6263978.1 SMR family transporter [Rhodococcus yunnanensis]